MKDLCKFIVVFLAILTALSILSEKKIKNDKSEIPKYYLTKGEKINGSSIVKKRFVKNLNNKSSKDIKPENDVQFLINKKDTYKNISNNIVNFSSSPSPSP